MATLPRVNSGCILKEQNEGAGINSSSSKAVFLLVPNVFSNYESVSKEVGRVAPGNGASAPKEPEPQQQQDQWDRPCPAQLRQVRFVIILHFGSTKTLIFKLCNRFCWRLGKSC